MILIDIYQLQVAVTITVQTNLPIHLYGFRIIHKSEYYSGCHKYIPIAKFVNKGDGSLQRLEIIINLTTAMLLFFIEKNLDFYGTMCHMWIHGTAFTDSQSGKRDN